MPHKKIREVDFVVEKQQPYNSIDINKLQAALENSSKAPRQEANEAISEALWQEANEANPAKQQEVEAIPALKRQEAEAIPALKQQEVEANPELQRRQEANLCEFQLQIETYK